MLSISPTYFFFFFNKFIYLFIYFWMCWVLASVQGLSPVAESGGHSSSRCAGPSPSRPLLLRSTSSRRTGSAVVAHGPSHSAARGIFPDRGTNPCPLHWQADRFSTTVPPRKPQHTFFKMPLVFKFFPHQDWICPPIEPLYSFWNTKH